MGTFARDNQAGLESEGVAVLKGEVSRDGGHEDAARSSAVGSETGASRTSRGHGRGGALLVFDWDDHTEASVFQSRKGVRGDRNEFADTPQWEKQISNVVGLQVVHGIVVVALRVGCREQSTLQHNPHRTVIDRLYHETIQDPCGTRVKP